MNRQVIPSMILSVLIVCFFSIVLYEREKPGAIARPGVEPAPAATSASASQNIDKPAAPSAPAAEVPDASQVVNEGPQREEKPASPAAGSSPPRTALRSPFATVKDGETLEDVTIRIYGSPDQLDLLWRANRDILPRKDSPLRAGAVLRTPAE